MDFFSDLYIISFLEHRKYSNLFFYFLFALEMLFVDIAAVKDLVVVVVTDYTTKKKGRFSEITTDTEFRFSFILQVFPL